MKNYLLPLSIIIAAIIIAFAIGHFASEMRIAQMCSDFEMTQRMMYETNKESEVTELINICLKHQPVLPMRIF